jgi:predicted CoA-binding protein
MVVTLNDDEMKAWLKAIRTIAVVGLSPDQNRPSHRIASSLKFWGYNIWPVNPAVTAVMGEKAYPDLASLPANPDLVLVFRKPEHAAEVTAEAVRLGCQAIWFQLGAASSEAVAEAKAAGLRTVADVCIGKEYLRLFENEL